MPWEVTATHYLGWSDADVAEATAAATVVDGSVTGAALLAAAEVEQATTDA